MSLKKRNDQVSLVKSVTRYLFWCAIIVVLVTPNLALLNRIILNPPSPTHPYEEITNYITNNFPGHPVVFVDMQIYQYHLVPYLTIHGKNDIYQGHLDTDSNVFWIYPDRVMYYKYDLHQPRNPVQGSLEDFLTTVRIPTLFFFTTHDEHYNITMRYIKETHLSIHFLKQWDWEVYQRIAPIELYMVSPMVIQTRSPRAVSMCESTEGWLALDWGGNPNPNLVISTDHVKEGSTSLNLSFTTNSSSNIYAGFSYNPTKAWDWSDKDYLEFWIYNSISRPGASLTVYVYSSDENLNRYTYDRLGMSWIGWRHFHVTLKEPTSTYKAGANLTSVTGIAFAFNYQAETPTTYYLYLDNIIVSEVAP